RGAERARGPRRRGARLRAADRTHRGRGREPDPARERPGAPRLPGDVTAGRPPPHPALSPSGGAGEAKPSSLWGEGRVRGPEVRGPEVRGPEVRGPEVRPANALQLDAEVALEAGVVLLVAQLPAHRHPLLVADPGA